MTGKNSNCYQFLSRNGLIISVLAGVAVGFALGFGLRVLEPSGDAITWIGKLLSFIIRTINKPKIDFFVYLI